MSKKRIFALAAVLAAAFILMACVGTAETSSVSAQEDPVAESWIDEGLWKKKGKLIVDPETGVHYILVYSWEYGYGGIGLTPRLNADGTPYTGEE